LLSNARAVATADKWNVKELMDLAWSSLRVHFGGSWKIAFLAVGLRVKRRGLGRRINIARAGFNRTGMWSLRRFEMQKHALVITTSAFILACGATVASAQQGPMTQQPQLLQQQQDASYWSGSDRAPNLRAAASKMMATRTTIAIAVRGWAGIIGQVGTRTGDEEPWAPA
jgi:hypothetical protein